MISLQINNNVIDFYKDTTISLTWKNLNFVNGNKYTFFTNDFTIPRTQNNETILNISEYWNNYYAKDNTNKGILFYEYQEVVVYVYVVSYTDNDIKITCKSILCDIFEGVLNNTTKLYNCLADNSDTTFGWSKRLMEDLLNSYNYRNNFLVYNNKVNNTNIFNRLHTSVKVTNYIQDVFNKVDTNVNFGSLYEKISKQYMVSTRKVVSPHNHKQILNMVYSSGNENEEYLDSGTYYMKTVGSQHITNDIPGVGLFKKSDGINVFEKGLDEITFNRSCKVYIKNFYLSAFTPKDINAATRPFGWVTLWRNNQKLTTVFLHDPVYNKSFLKIIFYISAIRVNAGDVIRLTFKSYRKNQTVHASILCEFDIVDYDISEDDYNTELVYTNNLPYALSFKNGGGYTLTEFNGANVINGITLPRYYFSYFGKYSNLPDVSIIQFLNSLCLKYGYFYTIEYVNNKRTLVFNKQEFVKDYKDYIIQEVTIYDDVLGEPSCIETVGGEIAKEFYTICLYNPLKQRKTITTTVFENQVTKQVNDKDIIIVNQYSYETDAGVEYLSPDGVYTGDPIRVDDTNFIYGLTSEPGQDELYNNGIEGIKVVKKVKVKIYEMLTFDNIISINGVRLMVQDMDVNLQTGTTVVNGFVLNK